MTVTFVRWSGGRRIATIAEYHADCLDKGMKLGAHWRKASVDAVSLRAGCKLAAFISKSSQQCSAPALRAGLAVHAARHAAVDPLGDRRCNTAGYGAARISCDWPTKAQKLSSIAPVLLVR